MYTPYLLCAYAATLVLVLVGLRVMRGSTPELRGLRELRRYILCALCALVLFALHARIPALLTIVAANAMLLAGSIFFYCATTEIAGVKRRMLPALIAVGVAAIAALLWATYGSPSETARLEIHCAALLLMFAASAAVLFGSQQPGLRYPARACGWFLVASAVVQALWGISGVLHRPAATFVHVDAVDAAFSYVNLMLSLSNVVILAWVSICAHRQDLQVMAQTDALTGLLNRGAFEEILRRELLRARSGGPALGLLLMDIDYFKQVNDEHGHLAGDNVLRRIGSTLRLGTRPADVLARFGGEEFVVLLRNTTLANAEEVAERLRAHVAALSDLPGCMSLTASFGVAVSQQNEVPGQLLLRADQALYRSKREGRNLVSVHGSEGRAPAIPLNAGR